MEPFFYTVNLDWTEGRKGRLFSESLNDTIEVATPPEFSKGVAGIWSPEHLFVASVSSCFMTTFLAIAENSNLSFTDFSCAATGTLESNNGVWSVTNVVLKPKLIVNDDRQIGIACRVLEKAEKNCLILHSIRAQVVMMPQVTVAEKSA